LIEEDLKSHIHLQPKKNKKKVLAMKIRHELQKEKKKKSFLNIPFFTTKPISSSFSLFPSS